MLQKGEFEILG